ncbi:hypothetical protein COLU111180_00250 [Cohnella lubricantis]|uniref:Uncharacterized protein n=1 Tax=Cohnella lubricantis TaxID=2163172 RepID=A0A841TAP6_9BACL|nr:hypothetical protein [Cohnella lubricantis]MBB6677109.1 hypothetical protein [Cohnella lubricantis]MBP2118956.1 hypothetical protein [Cohnella lubricantis]
MAGKRRTGTSGSVSIYFIATTAAFVLLTGLLIDFSRIAAFRKQAELAVKAGSRSVLSAFEPSLYASYGLFARGGNPADELFRETLEGNIEPSDEGAWPLLDVQWSENSGVIESRPLATHDVFKREVLEEMKYKAPIDLTIELAARFRGVAPALKEAKASVDVLERMRAAYDKREASLDKALDRQSEAGLRQAKAIAELAQSSTGTMSGAKGAGSASGIADVALMYDDYVQKREADKRRADAYRQAFDAWQQRKLAAEQSGEQFEEEPPTGGEPLYAEQTAAYEQSVVRIANTLQEQASQAQSIANEELAKAIQALAEAQEANEEILRIAEEAENMNVDAGGFDDGVDADASIGEDQSRSIQEIRQSVKELALDESFFDQYEEELNSQRSEGDEKTSAASRLAAMFRAVPGSAGQGGALRSAAGQLQSSEEEYRDRYGSVAGSVLQARKDSFETHRSGDEQRKQLENEAEKKWDDAVSWLGALKSNSSSEDEEAKQAYERLHKLALDNMKWNEAEEEALESSGEAAAPDKGRDEALADSDGLLDALGEAAAGSRDSLYAAEYAAERFTYADPSAVRSLLRGEGEIPAANQQLEYVLYGIGNASGNIAAAYGEIFAVRLAIRTMEGLIECRAYGHPLVILAAALVYAIEHAIADMNQLVNEGKIELSKYAKVDTYYLDYLRIFLLLHGDSASGTARSIAVIEAATGIDLTRAYTYVSGEATASLKLWFFPGLTRLLGRTGNWGGVVKDGRYEAVYQADDSYL